MIELKNIGRIYLPVAMALNEVRVRYARTSIGPWWQTINMLEFIQNHLVEMFYLVGNRLRSIVA